MKGGNGKEGANNGEGGRIRRGMTTKYVNMTLEVWCMSNT